MWEYVNGFCPVTHYTCLMPVRYVCDENGVYHKDECRCSKVESGECKNGRGCQHFMNAPDTLPKFKLRAKRYGE